MCMSSSKIKIKCKYKQKTIGVGQNWYNSILKKPHPNCKYK